MIISTARSERRCVCVDCVTQPDRFVFRRSCDHPFYTYPILYHILSLFLVPLLSLPTIPIPPPSLCTISCPLWRRSPPSADGPLSSPTVSPSVPPPLPRWCTAQLPVPSRRRRAEPRRRGGREGASWGRRERPAAALGESATARGGRAGTQFPSLLAIPYTPPLSTEGLRQGGGTDPRQARGSSADAGAPAGPVACFGFFLFSFWKRVLLPVLDPTVMAQHFTFDPNPTDLGTGGDEVFHPAVMPLFTVVIILLYMYFMAY